MGDEIARWRSPGNNANYAANVNNDGNVNRNGNNVNNDNNAVRPDLGLATTGVALPEAPPMRAGTAQRCLKGIESPSACVPTAVRRRKNTGSRDQGTTESFFVCGPRQVTACAGRPEATARPAYVASFDELASFESLYEAHRKARRGKRDRPEVAAFELDLSRQLARLSRELVEGSYRPQPYHTFVVREPKVRMVHALRYRDRVVQHALCDNVLEPYFERHLIYDNAAARVGKGTRFACDRLTKFLGGHWKERGAQGYLLKYDIRHYFNSVDHAILWGILKPAFAFDERVQRLIHTFVASYHDQPRRGLPLGNQTSSWFALAYLDGLDRMIKERLRVHGYTRYMDDGVLVHHSRDFLRDCLSQMREYVVRERHLEFNEKTQIMPLSQGVDYLGWHFYLTESGKVVRKQRTANKQRMKRRLKRIRRANAAGKLSGTKAMEILHSYLNHLSYGDTYALRTQVVDRFVVGGAFAEDEWHDDLAQLMWL